MDPKHLHDVFLDLKLKLQTKCFYSSQIKDYFFKPFNGDQEVSIQALRNIFESNGLQEGKAMMLARYIVEPKTHSMVSYNEEAGTTQREVVEVLQQQIGQYPLYNDASLIKKLNDKAVKLFGSCKGTLKETLQLEDYDEEGVLPLSGIKEAFETLDLEVDQELMDYLLYVMYQKSESLERLRYNLIFDLIEGKLVQG